MDDRSTTMSAPDVSRLRTFAIVACGLSFVFAWLIAVADQDGFVHTGLTADVHAYGAIGSAILDGAVPYSDIPVEHLPGALIPLIGLTALAHLLRVDMWAVWVPASAVFFVYTALLVDRIAGNPQTGYRFVLVSLPLLPLALFRLEPWVVLLATAAIAWFAVDRDGGGVTAATLGILSKGWPVTALLVPWQRGKRLLAAMVLGGTGLVIAVTALLPGFREPRSFTGIHTETVLGSLLLVWRHLTDTDLGLSETAGAVYLTAPSWAVFVNGAIGAVVIVVALTAAFGDESPRGGSLNTQMSTMGLFVLGIVLMSPLFSTQFLIWLTPFVAFLDWRKRRLYIIAATLGLFSIAVYHPQEMWWAIDILFKNFAVLALAVLWIRKARDTPPGQTVRTSRRNLPV